MKRREFNLLLFLILLIGVFAFYFLLYTPARGEIAALNAALAAKKDELDDAETRLVKWGLLAGRFTPGQKEKAVANTSKAFDDAAFIRRVKEIFPYAVDVVFAFPDETAEIPAVTDIHATELGFMAPYGTLLSLFEAFEGQDFENRIVNIECNAVGSLFDVKMLVEVLTERPA